MSVFYIKFLRRVRRFIFQQSQLALYESVMKQSHQQKIIRIYQDQAYPFHDKELVQEEYKESFQRRHKFLLLVYRLLFSNKKCTSPIDFKLLIWYVFVFISILFFFIQNGIILTFGQTLYRQEKQSNAMLALNIIMLMILFIDIIVQFRAGYLNKGMMIVERQRVIARYLRFRFFIDLLIVLILTLTIALDTFVMNYLKIIIILSFRRIMEIDKFYLRRLSLHRKLKTTYVIFKQVMIIFILSHIQGVIFYWIDFALLHSSTCQNNPKLCWLNNSGAYSPIISLPWNIQYAYIVYWGVSTVSTISYGDIASMNPIQLTFEVAMMVIDFAVYAYVVNNIIKILLWARSKNDKIKSQMIMIDSYMKTIGISQDLNQEVKTYLLFLHQQEMDRDQQLQQELKSKLPEDLRLQLVKSAYNNIFQSLQFMLQLGQSVASLLFSIKEQIYTTDQQLLGQGDLVDQLFFIFKGEVKMQCQYRDNANQIAINNSLNQFLAQKQFFLQQKMEYSITVQRSSSFYFIQRQTFLEQSAKIPHFREALKLLEYNININRDYAKILLYCPYCRAGHLWNQCPDKFPDFKQVKLAGSERSKKDGLVARMRGQNHRTLLHRKKLYDLHILSQVNQDKFYGKIGKKLMKIKDKIQLQNSLFEVDTAHDWSTYLPENNLSKIKQKMNTEHFKKRISRKSAFRDSFYVEQS